MDTIWIILISVACGVFGGGFLGYRYGRAAEARLREFEKVAVNVKKAL